MSYQGGAPALDVEALNVNTTSNSPSNGHSAATGSYKPLIDGSEGNCQANKSMKASEYDTPATAKIWWWRHPDVRQNWKPVLCSIVMLIVGILIIAAGIVFEAINNEHVASAIFIIIGFLFFVPGLYHTGYIYFAAKGMRGFEMNHLSIFSMSS